MAEVNGWHVEFLAPDVLPHVRFSPVTQRKNSHVFAGIQARIVEIPYFRPLISWIPLAKAVAKTEEPLFSARFFFITPSSADAAIEAKFFNRCQQRGDLQ